MPDINVDGQRLHVVVRPGRDNRPPLLLINGIGVTLEVCDPFLEQLDPAIGTIQFDVPGVGGSPTPPLPLGFWQHAHLIDRLLEHLGYDQVDLLGVSWGGGLAQQFALQYPQRCRRLILVSTGTGALMIPGQLSMLTRFVGPRRYLDADYMAQIVPEIYGGRLRTRPDLVAQHSAKLHPPLTKGYYWQLWSIAGWTSLPWLPLLRQPTLLLLGDDDPLVPAINGWIMASLIPRSRLHLVHDGHLLLLTSAREVAPIVGEFLAQSR